MVFQQSTLFEGLGLFSEYSLVSMVTQIRIAVEAI